MQILAQVAPVQILAVRILDGWFDKQVDFMRGYLRADARTCGRADARMSGYCGWILQSVIAGGRANRCGVIVLILLFGTIKLK